MRPLFFRIAFVSALSALALPASAQDGAAKPVAAPAPAAPAKPAAPAPAPAKAAPAAKPAPVAHAAPRRATRGRHRRSTPIPKDAAVATYPGFRVLRDGSAHVFVEVSKKIDVVEQKSPTEVVYTLKGAVSPSRNNLRPLPTGFFQSAVQRVQLVESGGDLKLVVALNEAVPVEHTVRESEGGILLDVAIAKSTRADASADAGATQPASMKRTTATTRIGDGL